MILALGVSLYLFTIGVYVATVIYSMIIIFVFIYLISRLKHIKILNTEFLEVRGLIKKELVKREDVKQIGGFLTFLYITTNQGKSYYFLQSIFINPFLIFVEKQKKLQNEILIRIKEQFPYNED